MSASRTVHIGKEADPSLKIIAIVVLAIHLAALIYVAYDSTRPNPLPRRQEKLVVKTVRLHEKSPILIADSSSEQIASLSETLEQDSVLKVETPQSESPKKVASPNMNDLPKVISEEPLKQTEAAPTVERQIVEEHPVQESPIKEDPIQDTPKPKDQAPKKEVSKQKPKESPKKEPPKIEKKVQAKKDQPKTNPAKKESGKKESTVAKKPAEKAISKKPQEEVNQKQALPKKESEIKKTALATPPNPKVDPEAEAALARKRELIAKAQASVAKIDRSKTSPVKGDGDVKSVVPAAISSLHSDSIIVEGEASMNVKELGYKSELVECLKLKLKLPEKEDAVIKLTLSRSGKVVNVKIVSSPSAANKKRVEEILPNLTFPPFGSNFGQSEKYTFTIKLKGG